VSSLALAAATPAYRRHRPEQTVLYAVVAEHYPRFLQSKEASGGHEPWMNLKIAGAKNIRT
jgi:hypothetical protein